MVHASNGQSISLVWACGVVKKSLCRELYHLWRRLKVIDRVTPSFDTPFDTASLRLLDALRWLICECLKPSWQAMDSSQAIRFASQPEVSCGMTHVVGSPDKQPESQKPGPGQWISIDCIWLILIRIDETSLKSGKEHGVRAMACCLFQPFCRWGRCSQWCKQLGPLSTVCKIDLFHLDQSSSSAKINPLVRYWSFHWDQTTAKCCSCSCFWWHPASWRGVPGAFVTTVVWKAACRQVCQSPTPNAMIYTYIYTYILTIYHNVS